MVRYYIVCEKLSGCYHEHPCVNFIEYYYLLCFKRINYVHFFAMISMYKTAKLRLFNR